MTEEKANKKLLWSTIFLHGFNDLHTTSLPTIIPLLTQSIGLTLSQAGALNAVFGVTNLFFQPVTGFFADRAKRPWFFILGPMLSIIGASLLSFAPNFAFALILTGIMTIGTGMFHPQGIGTCGAASGSRLNFYLSIFQAAGTFGSSLSPVYVVFWVTSFNKPLFPFVAIPVAAIILSYIWRITAAPYAEMAAKKAKKRTDGNFFANLLYLLPIVGPVTLLAGFRDAACQSVKVFLPTLFIQRGATIHFGATILCVLTFMSAAAAIIGGKLADKFGEEKVVVSTLVAAPVFLFLGIQKTSAFNIAILVLGFILLQSTLPVTTAMAQKRCPDMRGMASSLAQGTSWGLANLLVTPVGVAGDIFGLQNAMNYAVFLPWLVLVFFIPKICVKKK